MSKTVGFLITNFNGKGGTERVTSIIANGLSQRGYKIYIISCRDGKEPRYVLNSNVTVLSLHGERIDNTIKRKWNSFFQLKKYVDKYHIDIMVAVDVPLYAYLYPLQCIGKCRCIAWEHFNFYSAKNWFQKEIRKFAARKADQLVVLGKYDLENYKKNVGQNIKIRYIYNPIAIKLSQNYKGVDSYRILAVGRLENQKGFDRLIDAWNILEKKYSNWNLKIVGEGSQKNLLIKKIKDYGLKNVKIEGFQNNITNEYDNAAIYALSSRFEGFGLVLQEAQARKLPCISFNIKEGPREIISAGENGILVEDGDIKGFANGLEELMKNRALRIDFSNKAQRDLKHFETDAIISQWDELLRNI